MARFWDTSAVIPLLLRESASEAMLALLQEDESMIVWWGTEVEGVSALARRLPEGDLDDAAEGGARTVLTALTGSWSEIQPSDVVRSLAKRLLAVHPLRAADALQLASALVWSENRPDQRGFVCLDNRLREAASKEGFRVQPTS